MLNTILANIISLALIATTKRRVSGNISEKCRGGDKGVSGTILLAIKRSSENLFSFLV